MSESSIKKQARALQSITGMPYQSAHRAVVSGGEFEASVRSGLTLSSFITPREVRAWHIVNQTGALDCEAGRHWTMQEALGECVNCGAYLVQDCTSDGEPVEVVVDEERFFEECMEVGAYCEWAPPLRLLGGRSQAAYFYANWTPADAE